MSWVILTRGDRPAELTAAVDSLRSADPDSEVVVVQNGGTPIAAPAGARVVHLDENLGVPGGRHVGVTSTHGAIVGFLDDDATLVTPDAAERVASQFAEVGDLGAITFRITDEVGESSRRHVPRIGAGSANRSGQVVTFLGGASAIRRSAYVRSGGYFPDLFYAHEELDLAWRLWDSGFTVRYDAEIEVRHPRTAISRHSDGWRLTGRNRVMVARRNLPWPVAFVHVSVWLVIGLVRTPNRDCRAAYRRGWWSGWSQPVERRPMSWKTVLRITRVGRPPVI